jgi:hypothetical protein
MGEQEDETLRRAMYSDEPGELYLKAKSCESSQYHTMAALPPTHPLAPAK